MQFQELERLERELTDDLGIVEAKTDEVREFVYGGPGGQAPVEDRLVALEAFERQTKAVLFSSPGEDKGLIDQVKNRKLVAIASVVSVLLSLAVGLNAIFGQTIRDYLKHDKPDPLQEMIDNVKHPHKTHYTVRIIEAPEEKGQTWR